MSMNLVCQLFIKKPPWNGRYTVFSFWSTCCYGTTFEATAAVTRWGRLRINHLRSVTTRPRPPSERNEEKSTRNCGNSSGDTRIGFAGRAGMSACVVRPIPSTGSSIWSLISIRSGCTEPQAAKMHEIRELVDICPPLLVFYPTPLWSSFARTVK